MNKFEKALIALAVAGTVGFAFAFAALKGIPEAFDWELDEEESHE
jgi:hypothetical protein